MMRSLCIEEIIEFEKDKGIKVAGTISKDEHFFQDHFPEFPILPGVLAVELLLEAVREYYRRLGIQSKNFRIERLESVKFSNYLKPGDHWQVQVAPVVGCEDQWRGKVLKNDQVAVAAKICLQKTKKES